MGNETVWRDDTGKTRQVDSGLESLLTGLSGIEETDDTLQLSGATIDHYFIEERLRGGGMSPVYRATDTKLNRKVVLKFIPLNIPDAESRFRREVERSAAINHPKVVRIYTLETEKKTSHGEPVPPFITMGYVEGKTLDEFDDLTPWQLIYVGQDLLTALDAIHGNLIAHGDLKPKNVKMKAPSEHPDERALVVMDFGVAAKFKDPDQWAGEQNVFFVGTPHYASPEQLRGEKASMSSDRFSYGATMYALLMHRQLRTDADGEALEPEDIIEQACSGNLDDRPKFSRRPPVLKWIGRNNFARSLLEKDIANALGPVEQRLRPAEANRRIQQQCRWYMRIRNGLIIGAAMTALAVPTISWLSAAREEARQEQKNELLVRNPARLDRAEPLVLRGLRLAGMEDTVSGRTSCEEGIEALSSYRTSLDAPDLARYHELDALGKACLVHVYLADGESEKAADIFGAIERNSLPEHSRMSPDRLRVLEQMVAQNMDGALSELRRIWKAQQASGDELWAGNLLTRALTLRASSAKESGRREAYLKEAFGQAEEVIASLRPQPALIDTAGEPDHKIPPRLRLREGQHAALADALLNHAALLRREGEHGQARKEIAEAYDIAVRNDDELGASQALRYLGVLEYHAGNYYAAEVVLTPAIALLERLGSKGNLALALDTRGTVRNQNAWPAEAVRDLDLAIRIYKEAGNLRNEIITARFNRDLAYLSLGRLQEAQESSLEARDLAVSRFNDPLRAGQYGLVLLEGALYKGAGREEVMQRYAQAMEHLDDFPHKYHHAYASVLLAQWLASEGEAQAALARIEQTRALPGCDDYNQGLLVALESRLAPSAIARDEVRELLEANTNYPEVATRLLLAQARLALGHEGIEEAARLADAAIDRADETRNLYHALDVRLQAADMLSSAWDACEGCPASVNPALLRTAVRETLLEHRSGVPFYDPAEYDSTQFTGLGDRVAKYK